MIVQPICMPWRGTLARRRLTQHSVAIYGLACFSSLEKPETLTAPGTRLSLSLQKTTPARTRFAPSPTGFMHIGSLRTALYNWLLAKATGGSFILRIEDTDQARLVPEAEPSIIDDLRWAGLLWNEGPGQGDYGPYRQSQRLEHYKRYASQLLESNKSYRCFCNHRDLDEFTLGAEGGSGAVPDGAFRMATKYPGKCRSISPEESADRAAAGEPHVVRFKSDKRFAFVDAVYGRYAKGEDEEDFVIVKSDGFPTYHFANVVDDALMKITHVIRGDEWLISTPKHVALYDALGLMPPVFAHLGLLVGPNGEKLSKRAGDISVQAFRDRGYDSLALLNWLALHGSRLLPGLGRTTELVPNLKTLVHAFSFQFTKGAITPNYSKLEHIQTMFVKRARTADNGWALVARQMTRPVLKTIHAVEMQRRGLKGPESAEESEREYKFYDNEGILKGSIDVSKLGPLMPDIEGGIFHADAYDSHAKNSVELSHEQIALLPLPDKARYKAAAIIMHGQIQNDVPTHVVLATATVLWQPTRAKLATSLEALEPAQAAIGLDYSPITLWERLLETASRGQFIGETARAEVERLKQRIRADGRMTGDKVTGLGMRSTKLVHSWVRLALAGSDTEASPSTSAMFAILGPEEVARRLRAAITIAREMGFTGEDDEPTMMAD